MSPEKKSPEKKLCNIREPDDAAVKLAGGLLRKGKLVALPTETVYGLAVDASNGDAVASLYAAKGRPSFNPLIIHMPDLASAQTIGTFDRTALKLAHAFWPGPLTIVVPLRADAAIHPLALAGLDTVAIRVPAHPLAQAVLREAGVAIAAPSANPSGKLSPTTAAHVNEGLGDECALILDGGACVIGLESTIIMTGENPAILRPGGVSAADVAAVLGFEIATLEGGKVIAPGMLKSHYAPNAALRLNALEKRENELLLGFGKVADADLNLSETGDVIEAARNLFGFLHLLDTKGQAIAVSPIPHVGLGEAINERLTRAAAKRDEQ
jgi:L-threonylcarbamoyladenylate synthase